MRTRKFTPLKNAGQIVEEIDLPERATAAEAGAFANFSFIPQLALKNIHLPVLTPLVGMDVPGSPPEPVFDSAAQDDIQGNIIPGFNKDHQHFLFLRIRKPKDAKIFLREILPRISTMEEVIAFRRLYRSKRFLVGRHNTYLCSTWLNIGFSRRAIELLASKADADAFGDRSFQLGVAQRSSYLGDPTSPLHHGSPRRWKVGGPRNEADIVLILASDHVSVLDDLVDLVKLRASAAALRLIFEQRGNTLSGDLRGHEHFGFKDGISQPGVRGKLSAAPGDYITPRYISAADSRRLYLAKPGQQLVWPGQFLLGEPRQSTEDQLNSAAAASNFRNGAPRLVSGGPTAAAGRSDLLPFRRPGRFPSRAAASEVCGHAGGAMAEWRAHPPRPRRRQSGARR
jgi:hypothetical protein